MLFVALLGPMMVLESLPLAGDCDQTFVPHSPATMMNTDVVLQTLADVDAHEKNPPKSPKAENAATEASKVWVWHGKPFIGFLN